MSITELVTPADLTRARRAVEERENYTLFPTDNAGEWTVLHRSGRCYTVTEQGSCTCPDHTGRGHLCKHGRMLFAHLAEKAAEGVFFCRSCGSAFTEDSCPECRLREVEARLASQDEERSARCPERGREWKTLWE